MYSLLEHKFTTWSPSLERDADSTEQVQRCVTKQLQGLRHCSYDDGLSLLNLKKPETRRLQQDLIWSDKILCDIVRVDRYAFLELRVTIARGHQQNYRVFQKKWHEVCGTTFLQPHVTESCSFQQNARK